MPVVPRTRREEILATAAQLFSEQGYPATGVDEIGEAAGVTGPAVYRHFDNKLGLLDEVVKRAIDHMMAGVREVEARGGTDWEVLEGLARNMVHRVLADRDSWSVAVRDHRHLTGPARQAFFDVYRVHVESWHRALGGARPELDPATARILVQGALGITSPFATRYDPDLPAERTEDVLVASAMAVLRTPVPAPPPA